MGSILIISTAFAWPKTVGDYIGWFLFLSFCVFLWVIIYFFWRRAQPPRAGSENWLVYIQDKITKLDAEIRRLLALVEELRRQREELKKQAQAHILLREELEAKGLVDQQKPLLPLVLAMGSDTAFKLDLAAFRSVRTLTGMEFTRITDATFEKIKNVLDRERLNGHEVNMHLAVHSGPNGMELGGEVIDAAVLSEILDGVQILVIAGCESSDMGDQLSVVPYVITFSEKLPNKDASIFCRLFWTNIGNHQTPDQALRDTLQRAPTSLAEFLIKHW